MVSIPKGTFCVFVNSRWVALKETVGFNDVFKNSNFRKLLPKMQKGEVVRFPVVGGHAFKVQQ